MTKLLATVPMSRGAASGNIHVANIRILNSHPESANQTKARVCNKKRISYNYRNHVAGQTIDAKIEAEALGHKLKIQPHYDLRVEISTT